MARRFLIHPLRFGAEKPRGSGLIHNGLAITEDPDRHLRAKILAVLFTSPGERVNRPQFGAGLNRHLFEGLYDLTLPALEFRVGEALRRDIGDEVLIEVVDITASALEGELQLMIRYRRREDLIDRHMEIVL